ncbi:hypothetical protein [Actinomadura sp. 3N508]|uniref:hypothetical protein n=1 Tax=Actinomadura sp. 3N508 TaxID=3375153 RepID=UPI0037ADE5DD
MSRLDDLTRFVREHIPTEEASAGTCPQQVAPQMQDSTTLDLVVAYRTDEHDVMICRTSSGEYVYHGEVTGDPSSSIDLQAERTSRGYIAHNGSYTYEIRGRKIIIRHGGKVIGTEVGNRLSP